jgi:transposase-like protein
MAVLADASSDSLRALLVDHVEEGATVVTDGWQPYRPATRDLYVHDRLSRRVQASKLLPGPHRVASLAKRWLLGTHQGRVNDSHLASYLNEFVFRFNRRRSRSRGMLFYRVLELAVAHEPVRYADLIVNPQPGSRRPPRPGTRRRPPSLERPAANRPWRDANTPKSA